VGCIKSLSRFRWICLLFSGSLHLNYQKKLKPKKNFYIEKLFDRLPYAFLQPDLSTIQVAKTRTYKSLSHYHSFLLSVDNHTANYMDPQLAHKQKPIHHFYLTTMTQWWILPRNKSEYIMIIMSCNNMSWNQCALLSNKCKHKKSEYSLNLWLTTDDLQ